MLGTWPDSQMCIQPGQDLGFVLLSHGSPFCPQFYDQGDNSLALTSSQLCDGLTIQNSELFILWDQSIPTLPQPWPTKAELPSASTHSTMAVMIHHPQIHSSALWMLLSKDTFKMGVILIALLKSQTESKHSFKDLFNSPRRRHKVLKSVFH